MPLKGYRQTKEHRRKIGEGHKGKKLSEETKRKMGDSKRIYGRYYGSDRRGRDKAYQIIRRKNNPGLKTEEYRIYREKNPEKVRAHQMLNY